MHTAASLRHHPTKQARQCNPVTHAALCPRTQPPHVPGHQAVSPPTMAAWTNDHQTRQNAHSTYRQPHPPAVRLHNIVPSAIACGLSTSYVHTHVARCPQPSSETLSCLQQITHHPNTHAVCLKRYGPCLPQNGHPYPDPFNTKRTQTHSRHCH